jgi:hypothetical protein
MLTLQFDVLLNGDAQPVDANRVPAVQPSIDTLKTLHQPKGQTDQTEMAKDRDKIFKHILSDNVVFQLGFRVPDQNPANGSLESLPSGSVSGQFSFKLKLEHASLPRKRLNYPHHLILISSHLIMKKQR